MIQRALPADVTQVLLNSLPVSIFVKDAKDGFRYVWTNDLMCELAGGTMAGHFDKDFFRPEIVTEIRKQDQETVRNQKLAEYKIQGKTRFYNIVKRSFHSADGRTLVIGAAMDVTESEESRQQTQNMRMLLESLIDHLPVGVAVKDADHEYRFVRCNNAFGKAVRRSVKEILGHTDDEMKFTTFNAAVCGSQDREVMRTGVPIMALETPPPASGLDMSFNVTKFPLHLEDGRNLLVGTFADVTDLHNHLKGEQIINDVLLEVMAGEDIQTIFKNVADILHDKVRCDAIAVFSYHEAQKKYACEVQYFCDHKKSLTLLSGDELQQLTLARHTLFVKGEQYVVADCETSPYAKLWKKLGMKSVIAVPVFVDKAYWGIICVCFSANKRIFVDFDKNIMSGLANLTSLYLKHLRQDMLVHQALRLEAVAMLASGIAHDFNNILQVILGNTDFALSDLPPESTLKDDLEEIHKAAEEAKGITGRLLAFARNQTTEAKVQDLNKLAQDLLPILQRLAGKTVRVRFTPCGQPCPIFIDGSQVSQIFTNLVVNARDAILSVKKMGGEIVLAVTSAYEIVDNKHRSIARLTVTDNGSGIPDEIKAHIFDPFFTTKPEGKGTGLGLPTVLGIVTKNKGVITFKTAPGQGTTFIVQFPLCGQ